MSPEELANRWPDPRARDEILREVLAALVAEYKRTYSKSKYDQQPAGFRHAIDTVKALSRQDRT